MSRSVLSVAKNNLLIMECMTQLKKFLRKMEEVTQTASYWRLE
jgi:hypothetical protein